LVHSSKLSNAEAKLLKINVHSKWNEIRMAQAQEFPELVQGAQTPAPRLLNAHDFSDPENLWGSFATESPSSTVSCVLEDPRDVVIGEFAVRPLLYSEKICLERGRRTKVK
jgi:hypothetical protein